MCMCNKKKNFNKKTKQTKKKLFMRVPGSQNRRRLKSTGGPGRGNGKGSPPAFPPAPCGDIQRAISWKCLLVHEKLLQVGLNTVPMCSI